MHNFMIEILEEIKTTNTSKLAKSAVLLQPNLMRRLRKFAPSEENLKDAFFQLIKSSQHHYKPSSKYFLPVNLPNGLTVATLCYDQKAAEDGLAVKYLPFVSSKDCQLFNLLFTDAHFLHTGHLASI